MDDRFRIAFSRVLGNMAEPPEWDSLTAQVPDASRKRPSGLLVAVAVVAVAVVTVGVLFASGDSDDPAAGLSIEGVWVLTSYTQDGVTTKIDVATLGDQFRRPPWIEFSSSGVTGFAGCNSFSAVGYQVEGDRLVIGEASTTLAGCLPEPETETLIHRFLWSEQDGVQIELSQDAMDWHFGDATLSFAHADEPPVPRPSPPPTSEGRLECSPGIVLSEIIPDTGQDPLLILQQIVPSVVTVEGSEPFYWGLDASGTVVAYADRDR